MPIPSSIPPCSFPHTPGRAEQGAGVWEGLRRTLPRIALRSCLGNLPFLLTEELLDLLICCGHHCHCLHCILSESGLGDQHVLS